jgi:uncharacterized lipoprotein
MKRIGLASMFCLVILGCVTTITTRTVSQSVAESIDTKRFLDAVSYVLTENGFDIKLLNESYGLVNTDWRPVKSGADTAATILSAFSTSQSMTVYSRSMMVQVMLTENGYSLTPKLRRTSRSTSMLGGSSENVEYPLPESAEGQLAVKIVQEINRELGLLNNYRWEEKTLQVGQEY